MANQEHLDVLKQGIDVWNKWRAQHPDTQLDLSRADLSEADLSEADLSGADLSRADLQEAYLIEANLNDANLSRAKLSRAKLSRSDLQGANLSEANLSRDDLSEADFYRADLYRANLSEAYLNDANLNDANLSRANLSRATLWRATLVETNLTEATLTECYIYGISAWNVNLTGATQNSLVITRYDEPTITVDNLKIAQFIYLLLNNAEIREAIDTIAKKAVLILGRFTPDRKAVLDALRDALRTHGYLPILFDFEKPSSRDLTETVSILAHLSRFVIVDLTSPKSVPYELGTLVHQCIVPFQPILLEEQHEFAMLQDLRRRHDWFLPTHFYRELDGLLASLQTKVIEPAEQKAKELEKR